MAILSLQHSGTVSAEAGSSEQAPPRERHCNNVLTDGGCSKVSPRPQHSTQVLFIINPLSLV